MPPERRLWRESEQARRLLYIAVSVSLLAAGLWLGLLALLSHVIAGVFLHGATLTESRWLLAAMAGLALARAVCTWASEVIAQRAANCLKLDLRAKLSAKLLDLGPVYARGEHTGEIVHTSVQGVEALDEYVTGYLPARLLAGLVPVMVFGVILLLDPWTLPILLFAGPLLLVLLALIGSRARELTRQRERELAWMSGHFLDMLQGLPTLKLFGRSREQIANIEAIGRRYGNTTMEVLRTAFQTSLVLEWGTTAATALVAIQVSVRLMEGLMPFEQALTVLLLTPEFFLPLRQLAQKYHAGAAGKAAAERIYEILDTPLAVSVAAPAQPAPEPLPSCLDLRFEDVHFAYDGGERPALRGFSLSIPAGEAVLLSGPSGAGKSTVANLLLRFAELDAGSIEVGGVDLRDIAPALWRTQVAWVPQHPYLFHGSVADNLRLARPDARLDELVDAARAAHAHEFITRLPQGYDSQLGERGARLSGGEQQRLALARAFLKDVPLLILDEPASHLDAANQELVLDAIERLMHGRTVLLISHHLSSYGKVPRGIDQTVFMEQGRVVEVRSRSFARPSPSVSPATSYQDSLLGGSRA